MTSLSRVIKYGSVFTRVRDLMRAGVTEEADRPLWYDTMQAFPPMEAPTMEQEIPSEPVTEILYPEDAVRAEFYRVYGKFYLQDMNEHSAITKSPCHRFITKYQELEKSWTGEENGLFEATETALSQEGLSLRKRGEKRIDKVTSDTTESDIPSISKEYMDSLLKTTFDNDKQHET